MSIESHARIESKTFRALEMTAVRIENQDKSMRGGFDSAALYDICRKIERVMIREINVQSQCYLLDDFSSREPEPEPEPLGVS